MAAVADTTNDIPWYLKTSYPVLVPEHEALTQSGADFDAFLRRELGKPSAVAPEDAGEGDAMDVDNAEENDETGDKDKVDKANPFMAWLRLYEARRGSSKAIPENMMRTENSDLAYEKVEPLVDLMAELEDAVSDRRLLELLNAAWALDPLMTLKLIFNARSIHLGKSSRRTFYKCAGWLADEHPLTLVTNLRWLSRPTIETKQKKNEEDEDLVLVEEEKDDSDTTRFEVKHGVSHGYWKDLLNILALGASGTLVSFVKNDSGYTSSRSQVLQSINRGFRNGKRTVSYKPNFRQQKLAERKKNKNNAGASADDTAKSDSETKESKPVKQVTSSDRRKQKRRARNEAVNNAFNNDPVYRALHLTVARLFAEQLTSDLRALHSTDRKAKRNISLCGKWAPTHDHSHDSWTFVISSIAEIMYPRNTLKNVLPSDSREVYLRHAREQYRRDTSALRKHLGVVERDITAGTFEDIAYDRVPSIAMHNYSDLFHAKDSERFTDYLLRVAEGNASISGATLLPSTLVHSISHKLMFSQSDQELWEREKDKAPTPGTVSLRKRRTQALVANGQWNTLVQRIKDSGALSSSMAVCDVSGSMSGPRFQDSTCPMDSAIGLSLLVAEVTDPPFGGAFISFSSKPTVQEINLSKTFAEKIQALRDGDWGYNTNFVSVFEDCILPIAVKHKVKSEDMVKRVFVFSDMHFDQAQTGDGQGDGWQTSYGRIKSKFAEAGYEVPELVFWNLGGGRGRGPAPKPVTLEDVGTTMVSGYSQGMLKVFMDNGGFDDEDGEEDEEVIITKNEEGKVFESVVKKQKKIDPLGTVKKAVGHKAYDMLKVYD